MVECTRCGSRNDRESRFCAACGYSLLAPLLRPIAPDAGFAPNGGGIWQGPAASIPQVAVPGAAIPAEVERSVTPASPARATTPPVGQTEPPRFAPPVLVGFLVSFDGNELGRFWPLHQGRLLVGRTQAADGLDIAIDHGATSARHAQMIALAQPSRVSVQDLSSTNGTFLNDQRLPPGHAQMVAHGDRIRFGGFNVRVVLVV
jgi:hypothetical protein